MRTSSVKRFAFPLAAVSLLALLLGGSWFAEAKRGRARKAAPAASSGDCKKDTDCVMVPDDCCPCSQGGKQRAIPKKQRDAYEKDRKKRCADAACTEMMSTDPSCNARPLCLAGICELGDAPADSAP
jgi:hypothetical protein